MNFSVLLSNFLRICGFESTFYIPQIGEPFCFGEAIMGGASPKIGHGILPFSVLTNITPSDQKHPWSSKNLSCRTRWWFQIFFFHPYLGKWSNLTSIVQTGWNHQLENHAFGFIFKVYTGFFTFEFHFFTLGAVFFHSIPTSRFQLSWLLTQVNHQPSTIKTQGAENPKPQNPVFVVETSSRNHYESYIPCLWRKPSLRPSRAFERDLWKRKDSNFDSCIYIYIWYMGVEPKIGVGPPNHEFK